MSFRGTNEFSIAVSTDMTNWQMAVEKAYLGTVFHMECDVPVQTYNSNPVSGRYVKFTAHTFYGRGAGLQFFSWGGKKQYREAAGIPLDGQLTFTNLILRMLTISTNHG